MAHSFNLKLIRQIAAVMIGFGLTACADPRGFKPKQFPKDPIVRQNTPPPKPPVKGPPAAGPDEKDQTHPTGGDTKTTEDDKDRETGSKDTVKKVFRADFLNEVARKYVELETKAKATLDKVDQFLKNFTKDNNETAGENILGLDIVLTPDKGFEEGKPINVHINAFLSRNGEERRMQAYGKLQWGPPETRDMVPLTVRFLDEHDNDIQVSDPKEAKAYAVFCSLPACTEPTAYVLLQFKFGDDEKPIYAAFGQFLKQTNEDGSRQVKSSIAAGRFHTYAEGMGPSFAKAKEKEQKAKDAEKQKADASKKDDAKPGEVKQDATKAGETKTEEDKTGENKDTGAKDTGAKDTGAKDTGDKAEGGQKDTKLRSPVLPNGGESPVTAAKPGEAATDDKDKDKTGEVELNRADQKVPPDAAAAKDGANPPVVNDKAAVTGEKPAEKSASPPAGIADPAPKTVPPVLRSEGNDDPAPPSEFKLDPRSSH